MVTRDALRALAYDTLCVLALVIVGTRNHNTDTGVSGVLFVAAPFVIAVVSVHAICAAQRRPVPITWVWSTTVVVGMLLRNLVFDRGTALPFIIVATLFLGATMYGWRSVVARVEARRN